MIRVVAFLLALGGAALAFSHVAKAQMIINVEVPCGPGILLADIMTENNLEITLRVPTPSGEGAYTVWQGEGGRYSFIAERPDGFWCIMAQKATPDPE